MFMTGIFSGAANNNDPDQERDPPLLATPVTFPELAFNSSTASWSHESPPPDLQSLFARVLKPADVSEAHLQALNIQPARICSPDKLLPTAPDGTSYIPPIPPAATFDPASDGDTTRFEAVSANKRKDFEDRLAELRVDNDTGFRVITRTSKPGPKPPRIAYMRKFWEGIENMAQYWDTSLDQYYEKPSPAASSDEVEKAPKRQKLDLPRTSLLTIPMFGEDQDKENNIVEAVKPHEADELQEAALTPLPDTIEPDAIDLEAKLEDALGDSGRERSATPDPSHIRYKGRRIGSGRNMPDQFRSDTVKAFVEGVTWAFSGNVAAPRQMPIVQMNKLNLPVRQTAAVYRLPRDRSRGRAGYLEGPMLCIQVRPETDFDDPKLNESQLAMKARLDIMRELGGLLQCAQERCRQGKTEVRPGEGKWWTEKPRWGGGPGGEVENESGNTDTKNVLQMAEEMITPKASKNRKRKTPAMLWKELKCPSKLWDAKIEYEAIGKDAASHYDEIFMVSSLNHHISIVKLTVHTAYTEYLLTEQLPGTLPAEVDWCSPRLQRTQWYDLLDVEQRVEAFCALWGITAYLTRDMETPKVDGAGDVKMQEAS